MPSNLNYKMSLALTERIYVNLVLGTIAHTTSSVGNDHQTPPYFAIKQLALGTNICNIMQMAHQLLYSSYGT